MLKALPEILEPSICNLALKVRDGRPPEIWQIVTARTGVPWTGLLTT
jgi:hypothetical protein